MARCRCAAVGGSSYFVSGSWRTKETQNTSTCVEGSEQRELFHQYADAEVHPDVGVSCRCRSVLELGGEKVAYGREFEEEEVGDGGGPVDTACLGEKCIELLEELLGEADDSFSHASVAARPDARLLVRRPHGTLA